MFHTKLWRKQNQILSSITVFANRADYEIMWENIVEADMLQMSTWRMRIASLQTHTQNMLHLLLFHYNDGCTNVPHCYAICNCMSVVNILGSVIAYGV